MIAYLFDIDGTLIDSNKAGRAALTGALAKAFDLEDHHDELVTSGRTDRSIARDFFAAHNLENSDANWQRLTSEYHEHLSRQLPLRQGQVLPGVHELLDYLGQKSDVHLGLLTGNTSEGARLKLEYFGIWQHFEFGAYGELHFDRNDIAEDALNLVRARVASDLAAEKVIVIGDTPHDVTCGQHIGARVIAVATGIHPREDLAAYSPDLLVDDLSDWQRIVRFAENGTT